MLGYRDVMKIPKFQQVGVDNRETETNHNDDCPTFDDERENFHVQTFHHVSVSFPHV